MDDADAVLFCVLYAVDVDLLAVDDDLAAVTLVNAAQYLDEGGLSCAVLAQQRMDFTGFQVQMYPIQGPHAREGLDDAVHFQQHGFCQRDHSLPIRRMSSQA